LTDTEEFVLVRGEASEEPGGDGVRGGERRGEVVRAIGAGEEREGVEATPARDDAPGEWAAVATGNVEGGEVVQDAGVADDRLFAVWERLTEHRV